MITDGGNKGGSDAGEAKVRTHWADGTVRTFTGSGYQPARADGGRVQPPPRNPSGTPQVGRAEYIAQLEQRVDQLEQRNAHLEDRLRAVTALQAVDQAFYNHTVAQRNHAWEDIRLLKVTLEAARVQLATLARPR